MQQTLRPYVTTGVAIAGVGLVAVVPAVPRSPWGPQPFPNAHRHLQPVEHRDVALTTDASDPFAPWTTLFTNTANNLANLAQHSFPNPLIEQIISDPGSLARLPEVLTFLTTVAPDVSVDFSQFPGQLSIELTPLLTVAFAILGPWMTVSNAFADIVDQITNPTSGSDPLITLLNAPAVLLNAFLNGENGIGLLGMDIPTWNGTLVGAQAMDIKLGVSDILNGLGLQDQTLTGLLDEIGLGDKPLAGVATSFLDALGLGDQTPVDLIDQTGLGQESVASLLIDLLDATGVGNPTVSDLVNDIGLGDQTLAGLGSQLFDALGLGDQTVADLADNVLDSITGDDTVGGLLVKVLDALDLGQRTPVELISETPLGDQTVGGMSTLLLDLLGVGRQTPVELADAIGVGQLSLGNLVPDILDALNLGGKTPLDLLDQAGVGSQSLGHVLAGFLNGAGLSNTTFGDVITDAGLKDMTIGDIVEAIRTNPNDPSTSLANVSLGTILSNLGFSNTSTTGQGGITLGDLIKASGGTYSFGKLVDNSLMDQLGDQTVGSVLAGQGLGNQSLEELLKGDPTDPASVDLWDMKLTDYLETNLTTSVHDTLATNPLGSTDLDTLVGQLLTDAGMNNTTIGDLLTQAGLGNTTVDQLVGQLLTDMGMNNQTLTQVLTDLGFNDQDLDSLVQSLGLDQTVGSLLGDTDIGNLTLNQLLSQLLGDQTVGQALDQAGIGDTSLDTLIHNMLGDINVSQLLQDAGLGDMDLDTLVSNLLGDTTLDSLLGDLGFGNISLEDLLNDLGLSDLANVHVGDFFGSIPYLFYGLPEQIAAVLAGG